MVFRDRLLATIRAARPVLEGTGVMIVGSEVPNLFEPDAASTLVVSLDLDIGVPVDRHAAVKRRLPELLGPEKLVTDRAGEKGDRDLLVALGVLMTAQPADLEELDGAYRRLRPELRHTVRSNLTALSLIDARAGMPDPRPQRAAVAGLLGRLERGEETAR